MGVEKLVGVRLLSEVEMRRDRVLEEVDKQIAEQNKKSGAPGPRSSMLSGTISTMATASMKPAPSASKNSAGKRRSQYFCTIIAPPKHVRGGRSQPQAAHWSK